MTPVNIRSLTLDSLLHICNQLDVPGFNAKTVFKWVYKKNISSFDEITDISRKLKDHLKSEYSLELPILRMKSESSDGTLKYLIQLPDSTMIETVLIKERTRRTLCLSVQSGCRYACKFCVSGLKGFERNLDTSEIIAQFALVSSDIFPENITNTVFMGIGEPLDNYKNLMNSINILNDGNGISLGKSKITVSSCGLADRIYSFADALTGAGLSISLHAPSDSKRELIMPVNRKFPLKELIKALKYFSKKNNKMPVSFEYLMISGFNTSEKDADELVNYIRGVPYKLNLILYNRSEYFKWKRPSAVELKRFTDRLKKRKAFYTVRKSKGDDINAACGQLKAVVER